MEPHVTFRWLDIAQCFPRDNDQWQQCALQVPSVEYDDNFKRKAELTLALEQLQGFSSPPLAAVAVDLLSTCYSPRGVLYLCLVNLAVRDHRVATRGRRRSERLASRMLRAFSAGLALLSSLSTVHQSDLVVCRLERSWNRCLSPCIPTGHCPACHRPGRTPQRRSTPLDTPCKTHGPSAARGWQRWRLASPSIPRRPIGHRHPTRRPSSLANVPPPRPGKRVGNRAIRAIARRVSLPRRSTSCAPHGVRVATRRLP